MKKKKILIISYSYPPANIPAAQRPYSIAKYLDKKKFDVTVLTCGNQDSALGFDSNFNEKLMDVKLIKINGIKIPVKRNIAKKGKLKKQKFTAKIKQFIVKILSVFLIPDKAILWYPAVLKYIKNNNFDYDIVFSTSPAFTNHLIASKIIKKESNKNIKWISDFRDYHYLHNKKNQSLFQKFINKRLEKNVIKNTDKITFISKAMKEEYAKHYKNHSSKFYTIYNGYDISEYTENKIPLQNDTLSIFYAGSFYKGVRDPMPLFNTLENLLNEGYIQPNKVKIEIAGNFEQELINQIESLKIYNNINFLGQIPRSEVLKKYKTAHLLWLIVGDEISHFTGVPVKFYEYLLSGRPIINFGPLESEPAKIINDLKIGWNFTNNNLTYNIELFKEIIDKFNKNLLNVSLDNKLIEKYSRKNQTKELEKLF